jgi:cytochrome c
MAGRKSEPLMSVQSLPAFCLAALLAAGCPAVHAADAGAVRTTGATGAVGAKPAPAAAVAAAASAPATAAVKPIAGDVDAGRRVFNRCANCHQVGPTARSSFGPQLNGIVGRRAGAAGDYRYSPAMANSGIVWNEQSLRAFIRSPGDVVPGSKMRFWGIGNDRDLGNLLAYLQTFK